MARGDVMWKGAQYVAWTVEELDGLGTGESESRLPMAFAYPRRSLAQASTNPNRNPSNSQDRPQPRRQGTDEEDKEIWGINVELISSFLMGMMVLAMLAMLALLVYHSFKKSSRSRTGEKHERQPLTGSESDIYSDNHNSASNRSTKSSASSTHKSPKDYGATHEPVESSDPRLKLDVSKATVMGEDAPMPTPRSHRSNSSDASKAGTPRPSAIPEDKEVHSSAT